MFPEGDEARLAIVQRALAAVMAVRIGLGPYRALAGQPHELWRPRGVTNLLGGMPSETVIVAVQVLGTVCSLWVVVGPTRWFGRRPAFVAGWISILLLAGLRTSLGKIFHNDVLLILATVPVLASTFGARLSGDSGMRRRSGGDEVGVGVSGSCGDRRSPTFGWPVAVAAVVIALAYFFSGYQKVLHSGPGWVFGDNMANVMAWGAASGRAPTDAVALAIAGSWWASRLAAAALLGLELGFPVIVFWRRSAPYMALAAVALHVVGWLTLGLDYWAWIGVDLAVLVDWPRLVDVVAGRHRAEGLISGGRPTARPTRTAAT